MALAAVAVGAAACSSESGDTTAPEPEAADAPAATSAPAASDGAPDAEATDDELPTETLDDAAATDAAATDDTADTPADDTPADDAPAADPVVVPAALQFNAPLVGGGEFTGADVADRPTVFWFWAPWCSICNREAESVEEVAQRYGDTTNFIGVAWSGTDASFQEFIDDHGLTFPQISDDLGDIYDRFGITYQPALVVVNTDGSTETVAGSVDEQLLDQIVGEAT